MDTFGIRLGLKSFYPAVRKGDNVEVIANAAGDRTTPALVAFSDHDKVVGLPAKQGLIRNAQNTVSHMIRLLSRNLGTDDTLKENHQWNLQCQVVVKESLPYYQVKYLDSVHLFSPEECISFICETLQEMASHHSVESEPSHVVLTVPYECHPSCHSSLRSAATKAGFTVVRMISEPAAAMLAYDLGRQHHHRSSICVVVRVGGSSSSITYVKICNGMYHVISNIEVMDLGGDLFTLVLADHFSKEFIRLYKQDPKESRRSWSKLVNAAEKCKHTLSNLTNALCTIDSLHDGIDFSTSIARARMDMLCSNLLAKLHDFLESSLSKSNLTKEDIQKVVLSGGGVKLPCVSKKIEEFYPQAELFSSIAGDEVISVGAAKEAGIVSGNADGADKLNLRVELSCLAYEISLQVQGYEKEQLFSHGHPVPARCKKIHSSTEDAYKLVILQEDRETNILAKIILKEVGIGSQVDSQFYIDSDGVLQVLCVAKNTSAKCEIKISPADEKHET